MNELNLLVKRFEILETIEDHELEIMMKMHSEQLKYEEAAFDEILKSAKFVSEEEERKFKEFF